VDLFQLTRATVRAGRPQAPSRGTAGQESEDAMPGDDTITRLVTFVREKIWPADMPDELTEESGLLEQGVLDSLKTAMLLNFIRDELGVRVPPLMIEFQNFKDVRSIAAMVDRLMAGSAGQR
jgi:acyl carrier protein